MSLRISELLAALSHALDLTEGQPVGHAERTCLIALRVADGLGLGDGDRARARDRRSLLKDVGCSSQRRAHVPPVRHRRHHAEGQRQAGRLAAARRASSRYTARHVEGGSRAARAPAHARRAARAVGPRAREIVEARCERGADDRPRARLPRGGRRRGVPAGRALGRQGQPDGADRRGDRARWPASSAWRRRSRSSTPTAAAPRRARWCASAAAAGSSPSVVDAFCTIGDDDPLLGRPAATTAGATLARASSRPSSTAVADDGRLDRVAEAFADVIDAKSPFTARHSRGVAAYAVAIGDDARASTRDELRDLRRAGLLHDIGKLGVPNSILDKPGKLDRRRVRDDAPAPALHASRSCARVAAFARSPTSRRAPRAARRPRLPPRRSRRRPLPLGRASWPSPTSSRR